MQNKIHRFAAVFGAFCAIVFALTPFIAGADSGPSRATPPPTGIATPPPIHAPISRPAPGKRTIHGPKVDDDGCQDTNMRKHK